MKMENKQRIMELIEAHDKEKKFYEELQKIDHITLSGLIQDLRGDTYTFEFPDTLTTENLKQIKEVVLSIIAKDIENIVNELEEL
jgi:hypothetical protein